MGKLTRMRQAQGAAAIKAGEPVVLSETSRRRLMNVFAEKNGAWHAARAAVGAAQALEAHWEREKQATLAAHGVPDNSRVNIDLDTGHVTENPEPVAEAVLPTGKTVEKEPVEQPEVAKPALPAR